MLNYDPNQGERLPSPQMIQNTKATRYPLAAVRRAKTTAAWSSGTSTTANLLDDDGAEVTSGYGFGITVCFFKSYSADNYPTITDDMIIPVFKDVNGAWYCPWFIITGTECA
jgi:hypothetical protein